ncbi:hypothetical protein EVAR_16042_1 [Eumeta japonica]|uniref:Uncharacterized protein n=1 Tax=Eumeta variegata TaxID=151549 RepID=A0A4C1VWA8_EUMVA|nr:hypothetical protein EVAR_16042_1 [Eumeta japonica]
MPFVTGGWLPASHFLDTTTCAIPTTDCSAAVIEASVGDAHQSFVAVVSGASRPRSGARAAGTDVAAPARWPLP